MNKQDMIEYYEICNKGNFEEMKKHYTDDVIFQSGDINLSGKKVIEMFKDFRDYFNEIITLLTIILEKDLYGEDKICVGMNNEIECAKDGGEYLKVSYKAGDLVADRVLSVFYTLREGKICRIVPYSFE